MIRPPLLVGARYYNPSVGRFITLDPIKDGRNWYVYVESGPLVAVDPTGNKTWTCKVKKPHPVLRLTPYVKTIFHKYWCLGCHADCNTYCTKKFSCDDPGNEWESCRQACLDAKKDCVESANKFKFKATWQ